MWHAFALWSVVELDFLRGALAQSLSLGTYHSCAMHPCKVWQLYCWGWNGQGQVGSSVVGRDHNVVTPVRVEGLPTKGLMMVDAGGRHTCAAVGTGDVYCWGAGQNGQLGNVAFTDSARPQQVKNLPSTIEDHVVSMSAGEEHTCVALRHGQAYCWGRGFFGQLGDGNTKNTAIPVQVGIPVLVRSVSAGNHHSCAVAATGFAYCWGQNSQGQLGDGKQYAQSLTPVLVMNLIGVCSISASYEFSCALLCDGNVFCWGLGVDGQLGTGSSSAVPVKVPLSSQVRELGVGERHACAVTLLSVVVCWGAKLGPPLEVQLKDVRTVAAGGGHTCVKLDQPIIQTESAIGKPFWCWGVGVHGQLGVGRELDDSSLPLQVELNSTAVCLNECDAGVCDDQDILDDMTTWILWALVLLVFTVMIVWLLQQAKVVHRRKRKPNLQAEMENLFLDSESEMSLDSPVAARVGSRFREAERF